MYICSHTAEWFTAVGTIFLGLVALFGIFFDTIRSYFTRPRLDADISMQRPDCSLMPIIGPPPQYQTISEAWYCRLLVRNEGKVPAKNALIRIVRVSRQLPDGTWEEERSFLPANLVWSNINQVHFGRIYRDVPVHCDFGKIIDPNHRIIPYEYTPGEQTMRFSLCLEALPSDLSHLLRPGTHRISVVVAAENVEPRRCVFQVFLSDGEWSRDQELMLREGVRIRKIT
jgi:hypothetical protein